MNAIYTAQQNANSKKWRVVKTWDGNMRRLPGAYATKEEAEAAALLLQEVARG